MAGPPSFTSLLYKPLFDRLAVPAVLSLDSGDYPITVLDQTIGQSLEESGIAVQTMSPLAQLMMADLTALGINPDDLDGRTIAMNGRTWDIVSHRFNGTPGGIGDGTLHLVLEGDHA